MNLIIGKFDLVVVADYGHGIITDKIAKLICKKSKYLAVNCQINASNTGFQNLKKYNNFDFLVINESELRHQTRDRNSSAELLAKKILKKLKINKIIVTSGKDGAILIQKGNNKIIKCPAFANKIIDKFGSGDAMLAISSLCDKIGLSNESTILIASLAACQSVESMGNSKSINKLELEKSYEYILK